MYVNESPSDLALERADYNWPYLQTNNSAIEQDNDSEERQRARDRKSTRLNSSHMSESRMPSSA